MNDRVPHIRTGYSVYCMRLKLVALKAYLKLEF